MTAYTVVVNDDAILKWLPAALKAKTSELVHVARNFVLHEIADPTRVAAVVSWHDRDRECEELDELDNLDALFPSFKEHDLCVPSWVPKFYFCERTSDAIHGSEKQRFAASQKELLGLLADWIAAHPKSRNGANLRRQDLATKHRRFIARLKIPDELSEQDGDEYAYIPRGTPYWNSMMQQAEHAAKSNDPVLLQGATGSGKDVFARLIASLHFKAHSDKRGKFIAVNASTLSSELGELFGIGDAMATGVKKRPGVFEIANNGVLFLDEVATLRSALQEQLLRVLSSGDFKDMNGRKVLWKGKLITATSERIDQKNSTFRSDLFHRLKAHHVFLKGHTELDSPDKDNLTHGVLLCTLVQIEREWKIPAIKKLFDITEMALTKLLGFNFNGSIRELKQVIRRAADLSINNNFVIDTECLPATAGDSGFNIAELRPFTDTSVLLDRILNISEGQGLMIIDVMLRLFIEHFQNKNGESVSSLDKLKDKLGVGKDKVRDIRNRSDLKSAVSSLLETTSTQPVAMKPRRKVVKSQRNDDFSHHIAESERALPDEQSL